MRNKPKVLKFDGSADMLMRHATRLLDDMNYIDALPYLRRAIEQEPDNIELKITLAEVYTEMHMYEASNEVLFELEREYGVLPAECHFGLACNFLGLDDLPRSKQNIERYLSAEPDGEFSVDARHFLDMLGQEMEEYEDIMGSEIFLADDIAAEGKELLDSNCPQEAIRKLEEALDVDPGLIYARNNLSLAYYFTGDTRSAIRVAKDVLNEDERNVHANCNLAMFYESLGDREKARHYTKCALAGELDPESLDKAMYVMAIFSDDESIYGRLKTYAAEFPFDERGLFYLGIACANTGRENEANKYFSDVLKLYPDDCVASYYKRSLDAREGRLLYDYQVPPQEAGRRISALDALVRMPDDELKRRWNEGEARTLLRWGLELSDHYIKQTVAETIAQVGDSAARNMLSHFLLDRRQPEEVKGLVFTLLKQMGEKGPFFAYIHGRLVEARVGVFDGPMDLPRTYRAVLNLLVENMGHTNPPEVTDNALEIWRDYVYSMKGDFRRINNPRLWAAAVEALACDAGHDDMDEILDRYGVERAAVQRKIRELKKAIGDGSKG